MAGQEAQEPGAKRRLDERLKPDLDFVRDVARCGFFRVEGKGADSKTFVLDPKGGNYRPMNEVAPPIPTCVEKMRAAIKTGKHTGAMDVVCTAEGKEAEILRKVLLGYISYGLGLAGVGLGAYFL